MPPPTTMQEEAAATTAAPATAPFAPLPPPAPAAAPSLPAAPPPAAPPPPTLTPARRLARDPRHYQIAVLASLLAYGILGLDLEVRAGQALAMVAAALATQLACTRLMQRGTARGPARLAAISHTRSSRGAGRRRFPRPCRHSLQVANGPESKAREGRTTEAYSKYVEGVRPSGTQEIGPFPAPQQRGCEKWRLDPRSAWISALSLCLLLRTDRLGLAVAAAVLSIASKFLIRWRGKHLFNPTNFGLVALMTASGGQVWVSPGQWGSAALFGFLVLCLGGLVVNRAARSDVTYAFLGAYGSLLLGRALWLGQPPAIPLHQVASGAFLIFTFFMISDPKTTPDSRAGRILFAVLVALGAGWAQFALYRPTGLLLSLACLAPLVPLIDRLLPGRAYRWPQPAAAAATLPRPERSFA
jgi:hypothetical protein